MKTASIYTYDMKRITDRGRHMNKLFINLKPCPLEWVWFRPPGSKTHRRYEVVGHYGNTVAGKAVVRIKSDTGIEWTVAQSECEPWSVDAIPPESADARLRKQWNATCRILSVLSSNGPSTLRGLARQLDVTPAHLLNAITTLTLTDMAVLEEVVEFPVGAIPPGEIVPLRKPKRLIVYSRNTEEP